MKQIVFLLSLFFYITGVAKNIPFYINENTGFNYVYKIDINGVDYNFLLDTGADITAIDNDVISRISYPIEREDISNHVKGMGLITSHGIKSELELYYSPIMKLGGEIISSDVVVSFELGFLKNAMGINIDGIIGMNIINNFVWEFDNLNRRMLVYRLEGNLSKYNNCISYDNEGGRIFIPVFINKLPIYFKLDTGNNGSLSVSLEVSDLIKFDKLGLENKSTDIFNNAKNSPIIIINDISFDNKRINRVESDLNKNSYRNLIGLGFLKRFDRFAIIPNEKLFCYDNFSTEDDPITLRKIRVGNFKDNEISLVYNDEVYLNSILLKNGDVIKELNGKQYEAKDIEQVREILSYAKKLKLVIRRGEQTLYRTIE